MAETWDGYLNDIYGGHVQPDDMGRPGHRGGAAPGPVAEGAVGGGTGMVCYEFKGGIGTASRVLSENGDGGYAVGVLVQANFVACAISSGSPGLPGRGGARGRQPDGRALLAARAPAR